MLFSVKQNYQLLQFVTIALRYVTAFFRLSGPNDKQQLGFQFPEPFFDTVTDWLTY